MKLFDEFILEVGLSRSAIENYITFADANYNTFYINKKGKEKKREIDCPNINLKSIQRWILNKYLYKIEVNKRANGFVLKRGIRRNAMFHLNKKYILSIDIKDFFPSITQRQVFEMFFENFADKEFSLKMAKLCTYKRRLPQGAPTSPTISNLVFKKIDDEIMKYCNSEMVNYSRYADDLTFSSDNKSHLGSVYRIVNDLLYKNGFNLNKEKTRYLSGKGPMEITGVYINSGEPKVNNKLKRQIRAELHNYIIKGKTPNLKKIAGYISFIRSIELDYGKKIENYILNLKSKKSEMESVGK